MPVTHLKPLENVINEAVPVGRRRSNWNKDGPKLPIEYGAGRAKSDQIRDHTYEIVSAKIVNEIVGREWTLTVFSCGLRSCIFPPL